MKLYYAMGTCSLAAHIAIREAGLPVTLVRFDMKSRALDDGGDLAEVNSKGYVPVLELDTGERLTEIAAVLQYIADQNPGSGLAPPAGSMARYRLVEWLHFIGMEIHKIYWPVFHGAPDDEKDRAREKLGRSFSYVEAQLGDQPFLMGETFTVADAFLVTVLNWTKPGGIELGKWPKLRDYRVRIRERAAVGAALDAEGLRR